MSGRLRVAERAKDLTVMEQLQILRNCDTVEEQQKIRGQWAKEEGRP